MEADKNHIIDLILSLNEKDANDLKILSLIQDFVEILTGARSGY